MKYLAMIDMLGTSNTVSFQGSQRDARKKSILVARQLAIAAIQRCAGVGEESLPSASLRTCL
jgi:hypothetical protein